MDIFENQVSPYRHSYCSPSSDLISLGDGHEKCFCSSLLRTFELFCKNWMRNLLETQYYFYFLLLAGGRQEDVLGGESSCYAQKDFGSAWK